MKLTTHVHQYPISFDSNQRTRRKQLTVSLSGHIISSSPSNQKVSVFLSCQRHTKVFSKRKQSLSRRKKACDQKRQKQSVVTLYFSRNWKKWIKWGKLDFFRNVQKQEDIDCSDKQYQNQWFQTSDPCLVPRRTWFLRINHLSQCDHDHVYFYPFPPETSASLHSPHSLLSLYFSISLWSHSVLSLQ